jgi:hypothetical protein
LCEIRDFPLITAERLVGHEFFAGGRRNLAASAPFCYFTS